jgi:oligosaccharide repeat unit polymerase
MTDQALLVGLALLPFAVGVLARLTERSWVSPAAFFAFVWGIVALPAGLVFSEVPGIRGALVWIFLATVTVWFGTLAARSVAPWGAASRPDEETARAQFAWLRQIVVATALAGVGEVVFLFARQGFSLRGVLSYAVVAAVTSANRSDYLSGEIQQSLGERLAFLALYCGALFGGVLFRLSRSRFEKILGLMPLMLLVLVFGLYGSRMGALYGGSFWVGAYLAATVLVGTWRDILGWRFLFRVGLVAGLFGFAFSVATMVWRYSLGTGGLNWQAMLGDGVAFVGAFGIWFKDHVGQASDFLWGGRLLRKVVGPLGLSYPIAPAIDVGFTSSNVFTVLRDLIEDFGTFGSLLFLFAYGFVGRLVFARVARGGVRSVGALTLVYAFALTSVAFSIFSYTVTTVAVVCFIGYCLVAPSLPRTWVPLRPGLAVLGRSRSGAISQDA